MPVDAPLYPAPPYHYTGAQIATIVYLSDPAAIAALVPPPLTLAGPPAVSLVIAQYASSSIGPYAEAVQMLMCQFGTTQLLYVPHMFVTTDAAMAAGREIWGFPKKLAQIQLTNANGAISGSVQRPAGVAICSATMQQGAAMDPKTLPSYPAATLRLIPNPAVGAAPNVEIVSVPASPLQSVWTGTDAACQYSGASTSDPWHLLPVRQVIAATYAQTDFDLGYGTVLASVPTT
jgi:acetoacetate decarboxylase